MHRYSRALKALVRSSGLFTATSRVAQNARSYVLCYTKHSREACCAQSVLGGRPCPCKEVYPWLAAFQTVLRTISALLYLQLVTRTHRWAKHVGHVKQDAQLHRRQTPRNAQQAALVLQLSLSNTSCICNLSGCCRSQCSMQHSWPVTIWPALLIASPASAED